MIARLGSVTGDRWPHRRVKKARVSIGGNEIVGVSPLAEVLCTL
jgi:hypothetical protein